MALPASGEGMWPYKESFSDTENKKLSQEEKAGSWILGHVSMMQMIHLFQKVHQRIFLKRYTEDHQFELKGKVQLNLLKLKF